MKKAINDLDLEEARGKLHSLLSSRVVEWNCKALGKTSLRLR